MDILIRAEQARDAEAISQVTYAAFLGKFSDHPTEHLIVDGLRKADMLTLSLVAEVNGNIVGHVAFSPVTINNEFADWYGLGPVSVIPELCIGRKPQVLSTLRFQVVSQPDVPCRARA